MVHHGSEQLAFATALDWRMRKPSGWDLTRFSQARRPLEENPTPVMFLLFFRPAMRFVDLICHCRSRSLAVIFDGTALVVFYLLRSPTAALFFLSYQSYR